MMSQQLDSDVKPHPSLMKSQQINPIQKSQMDDEREEVKEERVREEEEKEESHIAE
jgi:hypothetical protein